MPARVLPKDAASPEYTKFHLTDSWKRTLVLIAVILAFFVLIVMLDIL